MAAGDKPGLDLATLDPPREPAARPAAAPASKAQLSRYVILHQLGAGGMGVVFAAYDEQLDRKVALKLVHSQGTTRDRQHQRTLREAKALARVTHPRVVSVYEVGETDTQVYLAMEFVDGMTLRKWQSASPLSWREIVQMYVQVGEGLHAAHRASVVHRDFKPDNVLVGKDGLPRVVDFGIAHLSALPVPDDAAGGVPGVAPEGRVTVEGTLIGTVGYMSPEQFEGIRVDAASDQWSFCAALYEALYGRLPFAGTTAAEQAVSVRGPLLPPPVGSPVPADLFRILERGLHCEPGARFASMAALLASLTAEYEQSAAAATLSRRTLVAVLAGACLIVWLLLQYQLSHRARIVSQALLLSVGLVGATLAAGYRHRATLRRNPFHRAMWTLFLITFMQNLCVRAVFTVRAPLPAGVEVAVEMIVWGGTALTMTLTLMRRMWWVALIPLGVGILGVVIEPAPRRLLLCAYPLIVGLVLWQWLAAARSGKGTSSKHGKSTN